MAKKHSEKKAKTMAVLHPRPHETKRKVAPTFPLISPYILLFVVVWAWAAFWYGDVFRIAREFSFWSTNGTLMSYEDGRPWEFLWRIGLFLLQFFRWPALGALLLSFFVTASTYLFSYCLRLRSWWRLLQFIPAILFLASIAYVGFDLYYETETGMIMGIPFLCFLILLVAGVMIRSFSRKGLPPLLTVEKGESRRQNNVQLAFTLVPVLLSMAISQWMRPYVRVVTKMQRYMMEQNWKDMAETGRDNGNLSYRPLAAYYAIALVQRGEIGTRLFDIRMDYDTPYMHGYNGTGNDIANYYLPECDFYAGLVETSIHHSMENMTMNGPNLRALKLLAKCALLTGEWEVAEKYFTVLHTVPFEGKWLRKYEPMLRDTAAINRDPEFHMVRLTEPVHDIFENNLVQPVFLGYNAALLEGRSINALWNSLAVHIYTKSMPQFIYRCQPMKGTAPPESFAEALALMSSKQPELKQMYSGLDFQRSRLSRFASEIKPYMKDKQKYAKELYPKYKGYYPYYYFFGNLKATKKKEDSATSKSGVN